MELESLQEKQQFLRTEIIEKEIDAEGFMDYMGKVKNEGENIDLDNWTLKELKDTVSQYNQYLNRSKQELMSSRISKDFKKTKIFVSTKKDKVKYVRDLLQRKARTCGIFRKIMSKNARDANSLLNFLRTQFPEFKFKGKIFRYYSWEIKSVGGFIFGFGARNELELTISSNFTTRKIMRKNEDCDWLKHILSEKNGGSYVPPLEISREFDANDKKGINSRIQEITLFLNNLLSYPVFHHSADLYEFMTQSNYKKFTDFRTTESAFVLEKASIEVGTPTGFFNVQISEKLNQNIKKSSKIVTDLNSLYGELGICLSKVISDIDSVGRSLRGFYEVTSKINERYNEIQSILNHEELKLPTILLSINNSISIISKNLKEHIKALYEFNDSFIKISSKNWNEFLQLDKKQQNQTKNYLNFKENLLRKKEKYISDPTKWELPEADFIRMQRQGVGRMSKEETFNQMFPNDNERESQLRIWTSFVNQNYLKSLKLFLSEHQKSLLQSYLTYSEKYLSSSFEINQSYEGFRQIIGI